MALQIGTIRSLRFGGPSAKRIQQSLLPMGPPAPGVAPAPYYASIARDQWEEYTPAQRIKAWSMGQSLSLLSADVQRGMREHHVPSVHPVLLVHTPSLKRSASAAMGKLERGVGSLSRKLSTRGRKRPMGDVQTAWENAREPGFTPLETIASRNSMVASIFELQGEPAHSAAPKRHVHFDEPQLMAQDRANLQRHATDPFPKAAAKQASVRPMRSLQGPRKPAKASGFILIGLSPELFMPPVASQALRAPAQAPTPMSTPATVERLPPPKPLRSASVAGPTHSAIVPTAKTARIAIPEVQALGLRRVPSTATKPDATFFANVKPIRRDVMVQDMLNQLCMSLALA